VKLFLIFVQQEVKLSGQTLPLKIRCPRSRPATLARA